MIPLFTGSIGMQEILLITLVVLFCSDDLDEVLSAAVLVPDAVGNHPVFEASHKPGVTLWSPDAVKLAIQL